MQLHYGDLIPNFVLNLPEPNLDAENDQSKLSFTGSLNQWVWPCSLILTEYLLRSDIMTSLSSRAKSSMKTTKTIQSGNKVEVQEKTRIVELGAGLGLPLMAVDSWLTHAGSRNQVELMATEYSEIGCEWLREIFGSKLDAVYEWDWNQISTIRPEWADAMLFLASDILYDPSEWPNIFMSLAVLLKRSPGSRCIMTYQCRSEHRSIQPFLDRFRLKCRWVPRETFLDQSLAEWWEQRAPNSLHIPSGLESVFLLILETEDEQT